MPLYDYECPNCGIIPDVWAKMAEVRLACPNCGGGIFRLISTPNIIGDIEPYMDDHMDQNPVLIKSRQHKKEEMKKRGLFLK